MQQNPSPLRGALIWATALSVALCWAPLVGPFVAGFVGGRKARQAGAALIAGLVPAVVWGVVWGIVASRQIAVGKDTYALAPLAPMAPATAMMLLGGALVGATGRGARSFGVLLALGGAVWIGLRVKDVWATVAPFLHKPAVPSAPPMSATTSCEDNLKKLYGAVSLYAGSWDDCLPPANRWATALGESSGQTDDLRCPDAAKGARGYAMNKALGGEKLGGIANKGATPLFFDSLAPGDNPADATTSLPTPGRHAGRNYVLYADGTVKPQ